MGMENNDLLREQAKKLRQISSATGLAVGSGGFKTHITGVTTGVRYSTLVVQEDTVFTEFKVNGISILTDNGMSGYTYKQGAYLPAEAGFITDFTLSAGSVIGYK
jgi:hypothetical protein